MKKKLLWLIPLIMVIFIYQLFFNSSYKASEKALAISNEAEFHDNYLAFEKATDIGIIFYPGGKVEYQAYAGLLNQLPYTAFLVDMPLDLAIFAPNRADEIIQANPDIKSWYMMGHSLGGVMAAQYAYENDAVKGLILLASYPQDKHDFSSREVRVLSILGENDGNIDMNAYQESQDRLPEDTTYLIIKGGNHAQMGDYGKQNGDAEASITRKDQYKLVLEAIESWID